MQLVVVYSSDDNYAQHTGISIISLLENNKHFDKIEIYIIDNLISNENKKKLNFIVNKYKRNIEYIDFSQYKEKLKLNMEWNISVSAYARLFITSILPNNVEKVLYFDCDIVVVDKLDELWNINIDNYCIAAVQDTVSKKTKQAIGLDIEDKYINSGMLLINLNKWREYNIEKKFLEFIDKYQGNVIHHDQGVINGVLHKAIKVISPKFNLMTVYYIMTRQEIIDYYEIEEVFYSKNEIKEAINNVVNIHYTPAFTTRPWVKGCRHPMVNEYWKYINISPWKSFKAEKDNSKIYIRIINWLYRNIPINMLNKVIK